ncbi:MAG TPA: ABC-2 transporter permease [Clostridiales bacterium]|nr:ABC-2 transporter permease [Clostridiales bacterium]
MKGLLLKDFYTLTKQMKIFLFIIVIWSLIPGFSVSGFAIVYAGMLPITALAYDERCKWDSLAAMMPYSVNSLVLSKYILGYILISCASLLSTLAQVIMSFFKKSPFQFDSFISIVFAIIIALIVQSINLPVMFRLGVEKGRYVYYILLAIFIIGATAVSDKLLYFLSQISINLYLLVFYAIIITAIINIISIWISSKIYKNKVN